MGEIWGSVGGTVLYGAVVGVYGWMDGGMLWYVVLG